MAQPYKGARVAHTVRIPADLHRATVGSARLRRTSFNDIVRWALEEYQENHSSGHPVAEPVGVRENRNMYDDDGNKVN